VEQTLRKVENELKSSVKYCTYVFLHRALCIQLLNTLFQLLDCLHNACKHTIQKLRVQTIFLVMNPSGLKHLEEAKDLITA
jgi:hypothetical protein